MRLLLLLLRLLRAATAASSRVIRLAGNFKLARQARAGRWRS